MGPVLDTTRWGLMPCTPSISTWPSLVVVSTPVVLADTEEYAPVTGGITTTSFGWIGAKIATYTKLPKDALQLSRVAVSWAGPSIPGALRAAAAEPGFQQVLQLGRSGGSP